MSSNLLSRFLRRKAGALAAAIITLICATSIPIAAEAETTLTTIAKSSSSPRALLAHDVADAIAAYTQSDPNGVRKILETLSKKQIPFPEDFGEISPVEQLRWAYSAAEMSTSGAGAKMVSAFVHIVSRDTPSILEERNVQVFLANHPAPSMDYEFVRQAASIPMLRPTSDIDLVIASVTEVVCSRGSGMSALSIMKRQLGLSADEVLESIIIFGSGRNALAHKLANLPDPPQKKQLAELAVEIMKAIPSARKDAVLGEAVFRWLGLDDPTFGEWARIRDLAVEKIQQGAMRIPEKKQNAAKAVATLMRSDFARMPGLFLNKSVNIRPKDIERMFFEYANRSPSVAAIWGFTVIGLKSNFDFDPYIAEAAKSLRGDAMKIYATSLQKSVEENLKRSLRSSEEEEVRRLTEEKYSESEDWIALARDHGPKPYHGYVEYTRLIGFGASEAAKQYARSPAFNEAVGQFCPATK